MRVRCRATRSAISARTRRRDVANTTVIDEHEAIRLLKEVKDSVGKSFTYTPPAGLDDVYPDLKVCKYQHDGEPSCMIGHALHLAGWSVEELSLLDTEDDIQPAITLWDSYPELFTENAAYIFAAAQVPQDRGKTWHEAYKQAYGDYLFFVASADSATGG